MKNRAYEAHDEDLPPRRDAGEVHPSVLPYSGLP